MKSLRLVSATPKGRERGAPFPSLPVLLRRSGRRNPAQAAACQIGWASACQDPAHWQCQSDMGLTDTDHRRPCQLEKTASSSAQGSGSRYRYRGICSLAAQSTQTLALSLVDSASWWWKRWAAGWLEWQASRSVKGRLRGQGLTHAHKHTLTDSCKPRASKRGRQRGWEKERDRGAEASHIAEATQIQSLTAGQRSGRRTRRETESSHAPFHQDSTWRLLKTSLFWVLRTLQMHSWFLNKTYTSDNVLSANMVR